MKKIKVFIFYDAVFSLDGSRLTIGGIQTYLLSLARVLNNYGMDAVIVQEATEDFIRNANGITVIGKKISPITKNGIYKALFSRMVYEIDNENDILIWGSFYYGLKIKGFKTIAIQHGISFDLISDQSRNRLFIKFGLGPLLKFLQRRAALKRFVRSHWKVCVDYNFPNWYRTFSLRKDDDELFIIPNFTDIPDIKLYDKKEFTKILFARRFVEKRGVLIMLKAAEVLLQNYPKLTMTFAGEGPLIQKIEQLKSTYPNRVEITQYNPQDSLSFHSQFDVAVIPTIGSEGTSLSLLEAMASGCAVICSNVGGMTNIVIDRFNGLMITPNTKNLIDAIEEIHKIPELGNELRYAAQMTASKGFSKELWGERWRKVIDEVVASKTE